MVVDYIGAVQIVRELKEQIEDQLDTELIYAAGAIPPGTDLLDSGAVRTSFREQVLNVPTCWMNRRLPIWFSR